MGKNRKKNCISLTGPDINSNKDMADVVLKEEGVEDAKKNSGVDGQG